MQISKIPFNPYIYVPYSKDQYGFVYDAILEHWESRDTAVPVAQFCANQDGSAACTKSMFEVSAHNAIRHDCIRADWGTPLGVPQYWFDQTWGKWAIIESDNFFFINRVVALSGRIWSELPDSNADGCFSKKVPNGSSAVRMTPMIW